MQENCVFCKIIAGTIPSATVYEDENFKAILDISPAAKGHIIILSKTHRENLLELDDQTASEAILVAKRLAKAMLEELNCDGINMLQNNGEAAGQSVLHYHIHLIPRFKGDTVKMTWTPGQYEGGEVAFVAQAIASRISK